MGPPEKKKHHKKEGTWGELPLDSRVKAYSARLNCYRQKRVKTVSRATMVKRISEPPNVRGYVVAPIAIEELGRRQNTPKVERMT